MAWDPDRYLVYADERARPYVELLARVDAEAPRSVVDLGCGPGTLTGLLAERWPGADVVGVDSSAEMIERAQSSTGGVTYEQQDLRDWAPLRPVDVLLTNATLQWVPDHLDRIPGLLERVAPGGWFAMQVPGNFDEPSHTLREEVLAEPPYVFQTRDVARPFAFDAQTYLRTLQPHCDLVDAWETTYLHVLPTDGDPDPVWTWISGTSLRPVLAALDDELRPRFEADLKERLREAYPDTGHGVVLPFRRVFAVGRLASSGS